MNRSYRTRHASGAPDWGPAPAWGQPLPGWSPLIDHGPLPRRMAGLVARWWWPTLAVAGFLAAVGYVAGHDHPSLSNRGLITIALTAVVIVLLTLHRTAGPWPLARATAEYTVVAVLAGLLVTTGGLDHQPTNPATRAEAKQAADAKPNVAGDDRHGMLRVAAGVIRAMGRAIRAVTGAASWVADLWRQADAKTDHPSVSPSTTTPKAKAIPRSPALTSTSTGRPT
jgi:hypothetical protein